jgi:hypothetical protein
MDVVGGLSNVFDPIDVFNVRGNRNLSRANAALDEAQAAAQAARAQRKFLKKRGEWLSPTEWVFTGIGILVLLGSISVACIRKGKW